VKRNGVGSGVRLGVGGESLSSSSGAVLLLRTAALSGLGQGLSAALRSWRPGRGLHDPGKTVLDLAVAVALGGDCLADVAVLRGQPQLFGPVASDPTVSRLIDRLAADPDAAVAAIRTARAAAREQVWQRRSPVAAAGQVVVDLDGTLVTAHSDKEQAAPTFKRTFGFHPLLAFVDHPDAGTGEALAGMLRPGNANANDAGHQIAVLDAALAQLPQQDRSRVLVRGDAGSGVKAFLWHVHNLGLQFSVGMKIRGPGPIVQAVDRLPEQAWRRAVDVDGQPRDGAHVAEVTGLLPDTFTGWPPGTRVIVRRERPHPGAQLRITDVNGWRLTAFATNTPTRGKDGTGWRLADLEVRHRLRARAEDRIRGLKDTGLMNLPLQAFDKNQIWLEIAQLAYELTVWTQILGFHDQPARSWEPKRLRLRIFAVAGRLIRSGRRRTLRISRSWPWADPINNAQQALAAYP
jgi:Transposase DDE domain group 1